MIVLMVVKEALMVVRGSGGGEVGFLAVAFQAWALPL